MEHLETSCPYCEKLSGQPATEASSCPHCGPAAPQPSVAPEPAGAKVRPPRRTALVAGLAVVVIGIACAFSYPIVRDELERAQKARAPQAAAANAPVAIAKPGPSEPIDPSERCELRVYRDQPGGATILVLTEPGKMTKFRPNYWGKQGRLFRELVRQAVLLAARDGLNLPVRDAVVGDPVPSGKAAEVLEIDAVSRADKLVLAVCRGEETEREVLLEKVVRSGATSLGNYSIAVEALGGLVGDELPRALGKAGLVAKAAVKTGDGRVPDGVDDRLSHMAFAEQFAAVRVLHAALRADGPSPNRLASLSRAYANLGLLTEFQWDAASVAYKARAILYAQRLLALEPNSPHSLWHRAYATGLAGILWWTADDLEKASGINQSLPAEKRLSPPGWVALLDGWCSYASDKLAAVKSGPDAELAAMLRLMTLEHPPRTDVAMRAARAMIEANPECFRAHDALCEVNGVANMHVATTIAPEVLSRAVPRRIAAIPGLPKPAREAADRFDEVAMTQALDDAAAGSASDLAEPSWAALARIVRETRFAFTCRRLDFMANMWSVPTDEYWEEVKPLVAKHRFRLLLESYVTGPLSPAVLAFTADFDTTDLSLNYIPLLHLIERRDPTPKVSAIMLLLADWTVRDLSMSLNHYPKPPFGADHARKLLAINPNSPRAMAQLIEDAWGEAEKNLDQWQKVVGDHPTFVAAMARHYVAAARTDLAEKALKRSIELSPDLWAFQDLAEVYRKKGNTARAKEVLDEFLTRVEDHGLDHATVRVAIANDLMKDGRYAEAWPYAEAAAQTWAGWAMTCAQNCAEGLKNWDVAEGYARAVAERYPKSGWNQWLMFCERTGHGDLAAARAWTKEVSAQLLENPQASTDSLFLITYVQLLCGDKAKAAAALRRMPKDDAKDESEQTTVIVVAALADFAGADEVRDAALERFCTSFQKSSPRAAKVLQMIRDAVAAKKPGVLDLKTVDEVVANIPGQFKARTAFAMAAHLMAHGHPAEAKRFWTIVANPNNNSWWSFLARSVLRESYRNEPGGRTGPREI